MELENLKKSIKKTENDKRTDADEDAMEWNLNNNTLYSHLDIPHQFPFNNRAGYEYILPAYTKDKSGRYLIFQDGINIRAYDPSQTMEDMSAKGLLWHHSTSDKNFKPDKLKSSCKAPLLGAAIDGDIVYSNMYDGEKFEDTSDSSKGFVQINSIKAFKYKDKNGLPVWTSKLKKHWFFTDKKFWISAPINATKDKIIAGAVIQNGSIRESVVFALNKKTGDLDWITHINTLKMDTLAGYHIALSPVLASVENGSVYVSTNDGMSACIDEETGEHVWISSLFRFEDKFKPSFHPPNPPVIKNQNVFFLPMNNPEFYYCNIHTGVVSKVADPLHSKHDKKVLWNVAQYIIASNEDNMMVSFSEGLITLYSDWPDINGKVLSLAGSFETYKGAPVFCGEFLVMLGVGRNFKCGLNIYNKTTWKLTAHIGHEEEKFSGNLLVAGEFLIVAGNKKITIYGPER